MARVLIVDGGERARGLARELAARGHAVRATARVEQDHAGLEASGAEAVLADPRRLATLTPHVAGVSVLCWLAGPAGERFATLLETLVDTHVRGAVYEAAEDEPMAARAAATYLMPVERVTEPPGGDYERWLAGAVAAVDAVLAA